MRTGTPPPAAMTLRSGFETITVRIDDLTTDEALVIDGFGKRYKVSLYDMYARGALPRVGEIWRIQRRSDGVYAFSGVIVPIPPAITGDRKGNTSMTSLLATLDESGLVVDQTTDSGPPTGDTGGGLPTGGDVGQLPVKQSTTNFDVAWSYGSVIECGNAGSTQISALDGGAA